MVFGVFVLSKVVFWDEKAGVFFKGSFGCSTGQGNEDFDPHPPGFAFGLEVCIV